jgi:DNA gyrase subunit A
MGKAIRFKEEDARPMGRASRGVTGIRFSEDDDQVIGIEVLRDTDKSTILSVCENGFGKRTPLEEYRTQTRGGKGIYTIKVTDRNGPVVGISQVQEQDDLMIMTSAGKIMRFTVSEIGVIGRLTQGVKLMSIADQEKVIGLSKVVQIGENEEKEEPEEETTEE